MLLFRALPSGYPGERRRETYVSAASQAPFAHAWIPRAHEVGFGSPGSQQPPPQGPPPPRGVRLQEVTERAEPTRRRFGFGRTLAAGHAWGRAAIRSPFDGRPRAQRRTDSRADFLRVQHGGKRVNTAHFVIMVMPGARQRLGMTVTRRAAGAVGRNRVRRLVREVFRPKPRAVPAPASWSWWPVPGPTS